MAIKPEKILVHVILIAGAIAMVIPFIWMLSTSLKTNAETLLIPPTLIPKHWMFSNYIEVLGQFNFARAYFNTILVTAIRTIGQVFLCSMAAFAIATLRFPGKNIIFLAMLSVLMFPPEMFLIPVYNLLRVMNWIDTYYALTIPALASAFSIFLLRQFFLSVPRELFEAAVVDGCSYPRIYWSIYMPISRPALISVAIFSMTFAWNDFLWPLVMTSSPELKVLSLAIASFTAQYNTNYALMMAAACISVLPLIIIYLFLQRYFIEGIALSGIKS